MKLESWLPIGFKLPDGARTRFVLFEEANWQILETQDAGRALVVRNVLAENWSDAELIDNQTFDIFQFEEHWFWSITCAPKKTLSPVNAIKIVDIFPSWDSDVQDALYVEKINRVLPTYTNVDLSGQENFFKSLHFQAINYKFSTINSMIDKFGSIDKIKELQALSNELINPSHYS